jgi:MtaA/CmuA family methyltransferase
MSNKMSPKERVFSALSGHEVDCIPVINSSTGINITCMERSGAFFPEAYYSAPKIAALAETGHTIIGFDSITPYFSAHLEAISLGCEVQWGDAYHVPLITKRAFRNPEEFSPPDTFPNRPPCSALLKAIQMLKKKHGSTVPIIGKVIGPWSLAHFLYGIEDLLMDCILEPQKIHTLLRQLNECAVKFAEAQFDAGADIVTWIEHASSDYFTPKVYQDFLLPLHKNATSRLGRHGPLIWTIFGDVADRFELLAQSGFPVLNILPSNDIPAARAVIGSRMTVIGTINNPDVLTGGSTMDVRRAVFHSINSGSKIIAPEAAISTKTPTSNLIELVRAAHNYKYI